MMNMLSWLTIRLLLTKLKLTLTIKGDEAVRRLGLLVDRLGKLKAVASPMLDYPMAVSIEPPERTLQLYAALMGAIKAEPTVFPKSDEAIKVGYKIPGGGHAIEMSNRSNVIFFSAKDFPMTKPKDLERAIHAIQLHRKEIADYIDTLGLQRKRG